MMGNPKYNTARGIGSSLQIAPPFMFTDTSMCSFPVNVNTSRLQRFIDQYLNQASDVARFEVFMPYMYLMFIDYGKMSIEAANMGWVSQTEVAFGVPLKWMEKNAEGKWEFKDWAFTCPYIFVDNPLSMTTGREVYGWPKVLGRMDARGGDWVRDPAGPHQTFQIDVSVLEKAYVDDESSFQPFMRVVHNPAPNLLDLPPNFSGLIDPLMQLPNRMIDAARFSADMVKSFAGIALQGTTPDGTFPDLLNPKLYTSLLDDAKNGKLPFGENEEWTPDLQGLLWSIFPRMSANTINLKQFRDACHPNLACYQAVTNSRMGVESINAGGPLGQQNMMFGQLDGGYEIEIFRYASQNAVDALGLLPSETRIQGGRTVDIFKPMCPYWLNVDMAYGKGKALVARTSTREWFKATKEKVETDSETKVEESPEPEMSKGKADELNAYLADALKVAENINRHEFNTARGAATQELSGPFELPDTTFRVLPLLADGAVLAKFARDYLDVEPRYRFDVWGNHVYLIASNYTLRPSAADRIGLFPSRDLQFVVPVKRYDWYKSDPSDPTNLEKNDYDLTTAEGRQQRDREKFINVETTTPFSYVDDTTVALTFTEVNGVPTLRSEVSSPKHTWMDPSGPASWIGENLLDASALVLPSLGTGAGATTEKLLSVSTHELAPNYEEEAWREVTDLWGTHLADDLKRKYTQRGVRHEQVSEHDAFRHARSFALELLVGRIGIQDISLKQFRDSWDTDEACYQAMVERKTRINRVYEINEIEEPIHVNITRYASQPVAEILGLIPKYREPGSNVESFQAMRPFWFRADITHDLGETILERSGTEFWTALRCSETAIGHPEPIGKPVPAAERVEKSRPLMCNSSALNHIDRKPVESLSAYLDAQPEGNYEHLNLEQIGMDLGAVDPATILDSILSRQWGKPAPLRTKRDRADFCLDVRSFGPLGEAIFPTSERQGCYWPQSEDYAREDENQREGLGWQLWAEVWNLIELGRGNDPALDNHAAELFPTWFTDPAVGSLQRQPRDWTGQNWKEVGAAIRRLLELQNGVDWPTVLRHLKDWADQAEAFGEDLSVEARPDAAMGADPDDQTQNEMIPPPPQLLQPFTPGDPGDLVFEDFEQISTPARANRAKTDTPEPPVPRKPVQTVLRQRTKAVVRDEKPTGGS